MRHREGRVGHGKGRVREGGVITPRFISLYPVTPPF